MLRSPALLMNWKSTATIGVVSGTLVTLLATASPSVNRQREAPPPATLIDLQQGAALSAETARLRQTPRPQTALSESTRNPFAFGHAAAAPHIARSGATEPLAALPSSDASRRLPTFTLVGLAEDRSSGDTVMTAILSSPGALQFVKQGDLVEGGYRVAAITSDSVELLGDDGRPLLLRLK
jgi:hypothetical protein